MKFVPVTVRTNPRPPAVAVVGEIEVIVGVEGGDGEITKLTGEDRPPALPEPVTVTEAVPALATSADVICACSAFALTNMVVRDLPFQSTVELEVKPAPITESVNAEAPATMLAGEIEQITGAPVDETIKLTAGEYTAFPPPP
jgi:hypothetical protein